MTLLQSLHHSSSAKFTSIRRSRRLMGDRQAAATLGRGGLAPVLCQLPCHHLGRPSMLCTELFWEIRIRPRDSTQMSVSLQNPPQATEREAGVISTWRTTSTITPDPCSLLSPPPAFTLLWVLIAETDGPPGHPRQSQYPAPCSTSKPSANPSLCALQSRPACPPF